MEVWLANQRRYVRRLAIELPKWYDEHELFTIDSVAQRYENEYARSTIRKGLSTLSKGGVVEKFDRRRELFYSLRKSVSA